MKKQNSKSSNETIKGPRYCSMVQSGSKNILLDNVDSNYAPVIYTRQSSSEKKHKKLETAEKNVQIYDSSHTGSLSSDDKTGKSLSLSESDNSIAKQQRVAEWVQNLDESEASSGDNSKSEQLKRFSDGDIQEIKSQCTKGDLLTKTKPVETDITRRKISNGKQKYQYLPQTDGSIIEIKTKNSHTETEI